MNNKWKNVFIKFLKDIFKSSINIMGSSSSKKETSNIDRIKDIDEDELDLSNIDRLQIKALKELNEKILKIEKEKSDKIYYKLPAITLCQQSLF